VIWKSKRDLRNWGLFAGLAFAGRNFVPAKTVGANGVSVWRDFDRKRWSDHGTVGAGRTIEQGYAAARACSLTHLTVLKRHLVHWTR